MWPISPTVGRGPTHPKCLQGTRKEQSFPFPTGLRGEKAVTACLSYLLWSEEVQRDNDGLGCVRKAPSPSGVVGLSRVASQCSMSKWHFASHGDQALCYLANPSCPFLSLSIAHSLFLKHSEFISHAVPRHSLCPLPQMFFFSYSHGRLVLDL